MRAPTTKARWFAFFLCGAASSVLACRRQLGRPEPAACESSGIVSSRTLARPDAGELAAEIVQSGCRECTAEARLGAPLSSPCSAASVCSETCCECPKSSPKTYYRARVCDSGRCAAPAVACAAARLAIQPDVCEPGP